MILRAHKIQLYVIKLSSHSPHLKINMPQHLFYLFSSSNTDCGADFPFFSLLLNTLNLFFFSFSAAFLPYSLCVLFQLELSCVVFKIYFSFHIFFSYYFLRFPSLYVCLVTMLT